MEFFREYIARDNRLGAKSRQVRKEEITAVSVFKVIRSKFSEAAIFNSFLFLANLAGLGVLAVQFRCMRSSNEKAASRKDQRLCLL